MPHLVTASRVAELSLQMIGAFSPMDTAPDPEEQSRALEWLSLIMDELTAVEKPWWAVPQTQTFSLVAGKSVYDLNTLISPRMQMIRRVIRVTTPPGGNPTDAPIDQIDRIDYEAIEDKTSVGTVDRVYVTRNDNPMLYTWRVPRVGVTDKIKVYGVGFVRDMTDRNGNLDHTYPAAWQLYLVTRLAWTIGQGIVHQLPQSRLDGWRATMDNTLIKLNARTDQENLDVPDLVSADYFSH